MKPASLHPSAASRPRRHLTLLAAIAMAATSCQGGRATGSRTAALDPQPLRTVADCPAGTNIIEGTDNDDVLAGTPGDDCILGHGGNDRIDGRQGNDVLVGGDGGDVLVGAQGNDQLFGEGGSDELDGGAGDDLLDGGDGDDLLDGGYGSDHVAGGEGDDHVSGGPGNDVLAGGGGADQLDGGNGTDAIDGGAGDDELAGGNGEDNLVGGDGNDVIAGDLGPDVVDGGSGNDVIAGGGGDTIQGGAGDDVILGGSGATVDGGGGSDACTGAACEGPEPDAPGCADDSGCPDGQRCNVVTGLCLYCLGDSECDDELFCNGVESCSPTTGCNAGAPPQCDDGVACTQDACDEAADRCAGVPADALCDNGDTCDGAETCDAVLGCQPGVPQDCGQVTEVQITDSPYEVGRHAIAADANGIYVVYMVQADGGGRRWVEMQRLAADGRPAGTPVVLSSSGEWIHTLDAQGGRVVWTAREAPADANGTVVVYDLASGERTLLDGGSPVGAVSIHGDGVAWTHEGDQPAVRYYDLAAGPTPWTVCDQTCVHPFSSLDLGSRYLVWEQQHVIAPAQKVVVGYDLLMGRIVAFLDGEANHTAREPSTFGDHTAYTYRDLLIPGLVTVEVVFGTRPSDSVFTGPPNSIEPSLGGELLAYARLDDTGHSNVEIVELATGSTVVMAQPQAHAIRPEVLGRDVVYLSNRNSMGTRYDIFLARLSPP